MCFITSVAQFTECNQLSALILPICGFKHHVHQYAPSFLRRRSVRKEEGDRAGKLLSLRLMVGMLCRQTNQSAPARAS